MDNGRRTVYVYFYIYKNTHNNLSAYFFHEGGNKNSQVLTIYVFRQLIFLLQISGGMDMVSQAIVLGKKPHVIIATPGRLVDHLENTKGFTLRALKYLVMDEADRILNMDFEVEVDKILNCIPKEGRKNMLFSATMTKKVAKLQRASLHDPVKVEVSSKYQTVDKLLQYYLFIPFKFKEVYLVHLVRASLKV